MAVTKRVRFEVMRRDNHACRYCGAMAPDVELTIDHVMPVALGGGDEPSNLVTACRDCNAGKTSTVPDAPLVEDVAAADLRLSEALRQAGEEILAAEGPSDYERAYLEAFEQSWARFSTPGISYADRGYYQPVDTQVPRPRNWNTTIRTFARAGLPGELLGDAIDIAMGKKDLNNQDVFRYMCGICWRRITAIQNRAAEIMAESDANVEMVVARLDAALEA